jgi:hypothetical protein
MSLYIPHNYCNLLGSVENTERAIKSVKDMDEAHGLKICASDATRLVLNWNFSIYVKMIIFAGI